MKKFRYIIEAIFLWLILTIFRILKPEWASNFGGWIGRSIGPKLGATRKAERNLRAAMPNLSQEDIQDIISGMWDNLGRTMAEYPHLSYIMQNCITIEGLENLDTVRVGAPAVFIGGHLSNWEIFPFLFNHRLNKPLSAVFREPNNPYAAYLLDQCRLKTSDMDYIPKTSQGVRNMISCLKGGRWLGLLIDQKFTKGLASPFFGQTAMTTESFAQMAKKFDCPIIPLCAERTSGCHFHFTFFPPLEQSKDNTQETVDRANALLEQWIRKNPSQWLWLHRRWHHKS